MLPTNRIFCLLLLGLAKFSKAEIVGYQISPLEGPQGAVSESPLAINSAGDVVGSAYFGGYSTQAVLWHIDHVSELLASLPGSSGEACRSPMKGTSMGIIVQPGPVAGNNSNEGSFEFVNGKLKTIGAASAQITAATDAMVVGVASTGGSWKAAQLSGSQLRQLGGVPANSGAVAVNAQDEILLEAATKGRSSTFVWRSGALRALIAILAATTSTISATSGA